MLKNYLKVAFRNLVKNKAHSFINIAGLSVGMAVAMLIGLWVWEELSFDKYYQHYDHIAKVMQSRSINGEIDTREDQPFPLGKELRNTYGSNFKYVVMSTGSENHIITANNEKFSKPGAYMEQDAPGMLTLKMLEGTRAGLKDPSSILLSRSLSSTLFGNVDPLGKQITIDNKLNVKVTGVYEDLPYNTTFADVSFIAPWDLYRTSEAWIKDAENSWGMNSWQVFVEVAEHADLDRISAKIKDVKLDKVDKEDRKFRPALFLQPMSRWHLYSEFKNGVNTGGRIQYVRLFSIIGFFVLLLACINFMNLSTARSEKRAKEVGIRKAIGSMRGQLIRQFYSESLLVVTFSFALSLLMAWYILPFFNEIADKKMDISWDNPIFWLAGVSFILITGLIAGSYPALYLSSFQPIKVLKGTFRAGRFAAVPRKVLLVLQFTVSVVLIIGTIVVFRQIRFAQDRPIGYSRDGLVMIRTLTPDLHDHFDALRNDLMKTGTVSAVAESESPATAVWNNVGGLGWSGKDPDMADHFGCVGVSQEYGKTIGWQLKEGRDFSRDFSTDTSAMIINETAAKYMAFKHPIGQTVRWWDRNLTVIGVIKDMVMQSPFDPVKQTFFYVNPKAGNFINIKINPSVSAGEGLRNIETICKRYSSSAPFNYQFADQQYAKKFAGEERVGKLASAFAFLAIFISCLGLFGMATFMAEQRIKEIGVRKVFGASIFNLWQLLTKDFVVLIMISLLIAMPVAYYFMGNWLENYRYRSELSWWIFAAAGLGALAITLLTVSYQSIKAALANPVRSLRSE